MFASNNKPSRRSSGRGNQPSHARSSQRSANGADAYSASKYGASTRGGSSARRSNAGGYVPASSASSTRRSNSYGRDAVLASHSRKKRKRKRILTAVIVVLVALVLAGAGAAWAFIHDLDDKMNDVDTSALTPAEASEPFYMLLIGVDKSQQRQADGTFDNTYRTDSMILARVDAQEKKVTLISIPRDIQVHLGKYGTQKINAAYAFGGANLAIETVSQLAGVDINHYAEIDFDGFEAIVDSIGGVDVNVPIEINDDMAGGHLDAGEQTLNGEQALILCRSRHTYDNIGDGDGDTVRATMQRTVISAIMKKLMSSDIATITSSVSTMAEYVDTDLKATDILGLAQSMIGIDVDNNVYTAQVPTESVYEDDVWYEKLLTSEWKSMMERVKKGLSPTEETIVDEATGTVKASAGDGTATGTTSNSSSSSTTLSNVQIAVRNGAGITGCASEAAAKLTPDGAICDTGNADDFDYSTTLIIYEGNDSSKAERAAELLGCGTVKKNDGSYGFDGDLLVVVGQDWS